MDLTKRNHADVFNGHGIEIKKKEIFKRDTKYIIWTSKYSNSI